MPMEAEEAYEDVRSEAMFASGGMGGLLGAKGAQIGDDGFAPPGSGLADLSAAIPSEPESTMVRSWFPETFIFEPLIETDDNGHASYAFTVPDRLTTWRILGLAHTRAGLAAGKHTKYWAPLPQYIDPAIPPFMRLNDRLEPSHCGHQHNYRSRSKVKSAFRPKAERFQRCSPSDHPVLWFNFSQSQKSVPQKPDRWTFSSNSKASMPSRIRLKSTPWTNADRH